ncbi:MAG: hybrid sensor histidine kinase/response regulator, partial [Lachnospiraceae bacterium]|nr:hybrid sensor histidine kinase/response regulator [Lachnospiraceae bacterium]
MKNRRIISILFLLVCAAFFAYIGSAFSLPALAAETAYLSTGKEEAYTPQGGGYAASGQMEGVGYTSELYDATNSLPTSDAMFLMGADDGHMWIGGYSGVIRYDGSVFERLDTSNGLTSARVFYEDSLGRIWVGTNDNGVVVLDGKERIHLTYKEGLPSSSIRAFAEDGKGNVFIGTTAGVCYADTQLNVGKVKGEEFPDDRILRLDADSSGRIYGHASSGIVFRIEDCRVKESFSGEELGLEMITTIMADPKKPGSLYIGTEGNTLYHGRFGDPADDLEKTDLGSLQVVHWLNYDCGRVWVSSAQEAGYLDENSEFHLLRDIPIHSGIEMITSDYQGNL